MIETISLRIDKETHSLFLNGDYNSKTNKVIKKVIDKKNLSKTFDSVDEVLENLNV